MQLFEKYLPYWPVIAASVLFLIMGLWWRLSAARAMELTPKSPDWVKRYRDGGFPFRRERLGSPKLRGWALLLVMILAAVFAAGRLANTGMLFLKRPELFFHSRYGILLLLLCAVGGGSVYCLLNTLFDSAWVALPGALLFSASAARGHGEGCFLALSLLLLLLYLRAERPGFPAELLYLAAVLALSPMIALRSALVWILLCYPLVHWYKLASQRRGNRLSGGALFWSLLTALIVWLLLVLLAALMRRFLMFGFRAGAVLVLLKKPERLVQVLNELWREIRANLFLRPTPGMTIDLMVDAPLFGFGLWGCVSAWILARKRRNARGVFALVTLAVLFLVWLLTGRYVMTLGLTLTAACILRDADIAEKRSGAVLLTLAGICWYVLIQIAAWYIPLTAGLVERLI